MGPPDDSNYRTVLANISWAAQLQMLAIKVNEHHDFYCRKDATGDGIFTAAAKAARSCIDGKINVTALIVANQSKLDYLVAAERALDKPHWFCGIDDPASDFCSDSCNCNESRPLKETLEDAAYCDINGAPCVKEKCGRTCCAKNGTDQGSMDGLHTCGGVPRLAIEPLKLVAAAKANRKLSVFNLSTYDNATERYEALHAAMQQGVNPEEIRKGIAVYNSLSSSASALCKGATSVIAVGKADNDGLSMFLKGVPRPCVLLRTASKAISDIVV
jgi:hypothetical protein